MTVPVSMVIAGVTVPLAQLFWMVSCIVAAGNVVLTGTPPQLAVNGVPALSVPAMYPVVATPKVGEHPQKG